MLAVARAVRRPTHASACHLRARRRARARVPRPQRSTPRLPARPDAHARLAPVAGASCAASRASASCSTIRRCSSAAAMQAATRRVAHAGRRVGRGLPRLLADARSRAALARERLPRRATSIASSCCRLRCTSALNSGPATERDRRRAGARRPAAAARLARDGRGRAVRVLVTGATGFTGGHLARASGARAATRSARWSATPRAGAATWPTPASNSCAGDLARSPRRCARPSPASTSSINIAALYRQAGLPRRGVSRGQRGGGADG